MKRLWALVAMITACGGSSAATDVGGDVTDMRSTDVGRVEDSSAVVEDASRADGSPADGALDGAVAAEPTITWAEGPALIRAVDHHSTMVLSDGERSQLVVVGGVETFRAQVRDMIAEVQVADILEDGALGEFRSDQLLAAPWSFHAFAQSPDGTGYVIGGVGRSGSRNVSVRRVAVFDLQDGALRIRDGEPLPSAFRHATAEYMNETIFVVGGLDGSGPHANVIATDLDAEGVNGPWRDAAPLPEPRTHHASLVHDDAIYVFGGFGPGDVPRQDILRSTHDASGELIAWEVVGTWDEPTWTSAAVVVDDDVLIFGGGVFNPDATNTDRVIRWHLGDTLDGPFEVDAPLPLARSHVHQVPIHNGRVYSVGGRAGRGFTTTDRTAVGTLASALR